MMLTDFPPRKGRETLSAASAGCTGAAGTTLTSSASARSQGATARTGRTARSLLIRELDGCSIDTFAGAEGAESVALFRAWRARWLKTVVLAERSVHTSGCFGQPSGATWTRRSVQVYRQRCQAARAECARHLGLWWDNERTARCGDGREQGTLS